MRAIRAGIGGVLAFGVVAACAAPRAPEPVVIADVARVDGGALVVAATDAGTEDAPVVTDAKSLFERAEEAFSSRHHDDAWRLYREITRRYAYSRFAKEAELRIADIAFLRSQYAEAARLYGAWVHDHRSDSRIEEIHQKQLEAQRRVER